MEIINIQNYFLQKLSRKEKKAIVILVDILINMSVFFGLILALSGEWVSIEYYQLISIVLTSFFGVLIFYKFGLYQEIFRYVGTAVFKCMVKAFIWIFFFQLIIFSIIGVQGIPRSIGFIQPAILFCVIGSFRYLIRFIFNFETINSQDKVKVLIFGAGHSGLQLLAGLNTDKKILIKGFIDDDPELIGNLINGICVYSSADLKSLIQSLGVTDVLLAIPSAPRVRRLEIINQLENCSVRVKSLPSIVNFATGQLSLSDLNELEINDLLAREEVAPNFELIGKSITNKVVVVTGAGGSIGSELCRQIIALSPRELILIDNSEFNLYTISLQIKGYLSSDHKITKAPPSKIENLENFMTEDTNVFSYLVSIRDDLELENIFVKHNPHTVFHAAAYKHVPLIEDNVVEGIRNNVYGTKTIAELSLRYGVQFFTLISTDKAVRPTSIMGVTKRISELILQSLAEFSLKNHLQIKFSTVRFGNVLGSSGSVVPLFMRQIKEKMPITLTHREVTRYFMSIPEAGQLVLHANSMAEGGEIFILDMGEPVRIYDLALRMIYLSGLTLKDEANPDGDIEIKVVGLRPGEKLYEELLIGANPQSTDHPKILKANEQYISWSSLCLELKRLEEAIISKDHQSIISVIKKIVPEYEGNKSV